MMVMLSYKLGKAFDTNGMSVNYGGPYVRITPIEASPAWPRGSRSTSP